MARRQPRLRMRRTEEKKAAIVTPFPASGLFSGQSACLPKQALMSSAVCPTAALAGQGALRTRARPAGVQP